MQDQSGDKGLGECLFQNGTVPRLSYEGMSVAFVAAASAANVDSQPLDLLVQGGKWNQESLRRLGLVPSGTFEHVRNDAPLDFVNNLEKRRMRSIRAGRVSQAHLVRAEGIPTIAGVRHAQFPCSEAIRAEDRRPRALD